LTLVIDAWEFCDSGHKREAYYSTTFHANVDVIATSEDIKTQLCWCCQLEHYTYHEGETQTEQRCSTAEGDEPEGIFKNIGLHNGTS
jgi:hypothetical protein